MSTFTMFTNSMIHIMEDNVPDINHTDGLLAALNYDDVDNTLYFETDRFLLNAGEVRKLILPNFSQNEWVYIILKVNGDVSLNMIARDYSNSRAITSRSKIAGNSRFPGILNLTTYNVVEMSIVGVSEFSLVESYASIIVEPNDARLLTN